MKLLKALWKDKATRINIIVILVTIMLFVGVYIISNQDNKDTKDIIRIERQINDIENETN